MKDSYFSIFLTFLKFGLMGWGGPVAQIAMIREELVERRKWIEEEKFNRALAVYQALPGPEAHELCVYMGMVRRGRLGGFLAGLGFMLPGFFLILLLASAYLSFGPATLFPFFVGVAPAVAALITKAAGQLAYKTLRSRSLWVICAAAVLMTLLDVHFLFVFLTAIVLHTILEGERRPVFILLLAISVAMCFASALVPNPLAATTNGEGSLLAEGLKAGMLSFGGAYTAIPFLKDSMVNAYPNITQQSFLDAIAFSSMIPAPLVIFGTFLGYLADGLTGAVWMTVGIFAPAFAFTLIGHRLLEKAINKPSFHGALDAVAAAVIGLLIVTAAELVLPVLAGLLSAALFAAALAGLYLIRSKWAAPFVILSCGMAGFILQTVLS